MKLFEIRDIVRENIGRDRATEHVMKYGLDLGLRTIEKESNFYWMRAVKTWSTVINQQAYPVTVSTSGGLNIPAFKDIRILLTSDQTLSNPDWDEVFGPTDMEDIAVEFADTSTGQPVAYSLDESVATQTLEDPQTVATAPNLLMYPPLPDKTYSMRLHYYQWTALPTATTSEAHEVLRRWPEALIYASCGAIFTSLLKDPQAGQFWLSKLMDPRQGEMKKIKDYDKARQQDSRVELRPQRGGIPARRRRMWRRGQEIWM